MYRPITMYQIVCDRCGEVFGGTDTCSALFSNKEVDIGDYSDWEMIDGKHYCPDCYEVEVIDGVYNVKAKEKQRMRIQTALSDKLKKHSSHHASIPDWMHDCAEWDDCNILIENVEQKNKQRMKIRLAKKIMKPSFRNGKIGYWHSRYDLHCMWFDGCRDHRIAKAISLISKKK